MFSFKSIFLALLIVLIFNCLNIESLSISSSSSSSATTTKPLLYSLLIDSEFKSNQTLAVIDVTSGEVIKNVTFHSLKQIIEIISVNETANTLLIYCVTPQFNNTLQMNEFNMTSLTFTPVGLRVNNDNLHLIGFDQPYQYNNGILYNFVSDEGNIMYFLSVQSWNFNIGHWDIFAIQVSNFIPKPQSAIYPYGTFDPISGLMYSTYQSSENTSITCVAEFNPLERGVVLNQYNDISGVSLDLIKLIFTDNKSQVYAIYVSSFRGIEICKFNFEKLNCEHQISITLGNNYQMYRYRPFMQSNDKSSLILLSPSPESTDEKPILQIDYYDISTWSLKYSTVTPNVWSGNLNSFDYSTTFVSN